MLYLFFKLEFYDSYVHFSAALIIGFAVLDSFYIFSSNDYWSWLIKNSHGLLRIEMQQYMGHIHLYTKYVLFAAKVQSDRKGWQWPFLKYGVAWQFYNCAIEKKSLGPFCWHYKVITKLLSSCQVAFTTLFPIDYT